MADDELGANVDLPASAHSNHFIDNYSRFAFGEMDAMSIRFTVKVVAVSFHPWRDEPLF